MKTSAEILAEIDRRIKKCRQLMTQAERTHASFTHFALTDRLSTLIGLGWVYTPLARPGAFQAVGRCFFEIEPNSASIRLLRSTEDNATHDRTAADRPSR